jgi:hypothetical protein
VLEPFYDTSTPLVESSNFQDLTREHVEPELKEQEQEQQQGSGAFDLPAIIIIIRKPGS